MSTTIIVTIFFMAIAGLVCFLQRKDSKEIKSRIKLMKAEKEANSEQESLAEEQYKIFLEIKTLCVKGTHFANRINFATYSSEKIDIDKLYELRSGYLKLREDTFRLLFDVTDDIVFGLCSSAIIGMLIRSGDFEAAKDVFKNVKHALSIEDISDKYKFLLDEIPSDKEFEEEFSDILLELKKKESSTRERMRSHM